MRLHVMISTVVRVSSIIINIVASVSFEEQVLIDKGGFVLTIDHLSKLCRISILILILILILISEFSTILAASHVLAHMIELKVNYITR